MGYIILGIFIAFILGCLGSFIGGVIHGKKLAAAEYAEDQRRKAKNEKQFRVTEDEIKQEVFKNAAEKKSEMAGHVDSVDRFNDINSKLSDNSRNRNNP
ncbi:hypothetical protein FACS1894161_2450 [Spirochaetia bacterium]|nr:hypothetical protein FACS1894161_2450 [Spirochaetia bacterium]